MVYIDGYLEDNRRDPVHDNIRLFFIVCILIITDKNIALIFHCNPEMRFSCHNICVQYKEYKNFK